MKDKIVMKVYDMLDTLEKKIDELIKINEDEIVKSITSYDFYTKTYHSVFKE